MRDARLALLLFASLFTSLLAGCGQTGKLYLPEETGEVVTRPASSEPPPVDAPANSPQTVDSPPASDTPTERDDKKDKKN